MTPKQRLAFLILQISYGYPCWSQALKLARSAARGNPNPDAVLAAEAVRCSLDAAAAAVASMHSPQRERLERAPVLVA